MTNEEQRKIIEDLKEGVRLREAQRQAQFEREQRTRERLYEERMKRKAEERARAAAVPEHEKMTVLLKDTRTAVQEYGPDGAYQSEAWAIKTAIENYGRILEYLLENVGQNDPAAGSGS